VIGNAWNDRRGAERDHGYCIFSITGDRGRVLCGSAIIGPLSERFYVGALQNYTMLSLLNRTDKP
jgi:hypothetical protein